MHLRRDTIGISAGGSEYFLRRPADLGDTLTIGITCGTGEVRIWKITVESPLHRIDESFDQASIINLGLEKMFKVKSTHTKKRGAHRP